MSEGPEQVSRSALFLQPGEGRAYDMGRMTALFKADGDETGSRYNVSEWRLEAHSHGPGAHSHDEDDIFYVIEGTMSFLIEGMWVDAPAGSFVLVPGGMTHDFKNSSAEPARALNFGAPGGFESMMPNLVEYFAEHPVPDA